MQILVEPSPTPPDCPPGPPHALATLVEITSWRAREQPNDPAYVYLADGEQEERRLSYAELDRRARRLASELEARGLRGERVLVVMNPGLEYNTAIFGCLYARVVAVPVYPPDPFRAHRTLPRLEAIVGDAQAALVLSSEEILQWAGPMIETTCGAPTLAIEGMLELGGTPRVFDGRDVGAPTDHALRKASGHATQPPAPDLNDLALLQYTSGSTGAPKGVMLTHANLMHNLAALHRIDKPAAVAVSWLPPYHDMGLIGGILLPAHSGRPVVLMSPLAFVQRPVRWLRAISRYRACTSGSPNFGYELCLRKIRPEECDGLDLSCWAVAISGAEPVQADTLDRFAERFGPCGFRREAFYPAFGMAESTLLVSGGCRGDGPLVIRVSGEAMEKGSVEDADASHDGTRRLVGCGQPIPKGEIVIVDPQTRCPLPAGAVGEVWVRSPSVALGYWNRPEETQEAFRARLATYVGRPFQAVRDGVERPSYGDSPAGSYLRTGDLGFIHRDQLFIAGRLKELIILGGRNYYPHDVERTVQRTHPALKSDGGAAFSIERDGEERLVVVQEVLRPKGYDLDAILRDIRRELTDEYEWSPYAVVLIPAGTLPKTSSGKTRRNACREMFLRGEFSALAEWRAAVGHDFIVPGISGAEGVSGEPADPLQTPLEHKLAQLWSDVLGIEPKSRGDDFFALGGQSLRASQLTTRLREEFGIDVPLSVLFERPTIGQQAEWLEGTSKGSGVFFHVGGRDFPMRTTLTADVEKDSRPLGLARRKADQPAALSCSEERLWFFDQLQPGHPFYNMPAAVRIRGPLDAEILHRAIGELTVRHEILRTSFPSDRGRPVRRIAESVEIPIQFVDLQDLPADERETEMQRCLRSEAARPFDLGAGPLLRCFVYRLGTEDHVVLLAMHHIICDGWSMGLVLCELSASYAILAACRDPEFGAGPCRPGGARPTSDDGPQAGPTRPGSESVISPRTVQRPAEVQYADFAVWQQERLTAGVFDEQLAYWERQLGGTPPLLELPTDRPRSAAQTFAGALRPMSVTADTLAAIDALARREKTTRFVVLMAAYNVLLSRYARQEDIAVGTIVANRTRRELENFVGFFANTVVLRTDLSGDPTFRELVGRVHRVTLEAHAHQEVPFGKVVERLQPERCGNRPPLFQAALVLENMPLDLQSGTSWQIERLAVDNGTAKYELALLLWEEGNRLRGEVEYSTALFDAATIDGMIEALGTLLGAAVGNPDATILRLPLVGPSLWQRIASGLMPNQAADLVVQPSRLRVSAGETPAPQSVRASATAENVLVAEQCLHHLFEEQAANAPDRIALVSGTRQLTYGELDRQSACVAAYLQAEGLSADEPVTVCVPRSAELVIAMLGVLKAGGVYVPLDPEQPGERIAYLMADSAARLLVTRRDLQPQLPPTSGTILPWEEIAEAIDRGDGTQLNGLAQFGEFRAGPCRPAGVLKTEDDGPQAGPTRPGSELRSRSESRFRSESLAYILYTSGSTGRPKGAMVEHRGVVNFVRAFSRGLGITPEDRVLHSFSPSSDGSLSDVFSALANGACLAVAERETVLTPGALEDLIRRERVTIATLTPSMMTLLRPENLPELRTVCSVGEPISGQLAARWSAGRRLINGYGLTETSIGVSLAELPGPVSRPTIGRPLENVQVYVLDPHLEPVPIGAVGEICIGGVQVGRGYLNRPELTEARFVPDPFKPAALTTEYSVPSTQYSVLGTPYSVPSTACCDSTGSFQRSLKRCPEAHADRTSDLHSARTLASSAAARLYRTGDLGRLRADGSIELLGRSDDQVKIRGYRVEPGEIAAALEEHPEVGQAAVVLWEDRPGDGQLVAYVVLRRTAFPGRPRRPGKAVLRAHLRKRLPEHMIPGQFVVLDALPRTVQGKIDRQRLPPPPKPDFGSQDRRGPRDELETLVAAVWQEVLGVGEVGCDEDFFALGGHSLLAVRVMAEIEARTGRRLPLAALFQEATVAHLAGLLRNPAACRAESALVPLQTSGNGRPFFCIHPAGGTVFCYRALAEHLGPERPFYGIQALGVDGSQTPHTSVDDMVAHYIAAIRSVQPHGPYLLGGWSLGGNLAFETARQLSLQGEPIGLLALLDAGALYADRGPTEDDFLPMIMALFPLETNLPLEELRKLNPQEQLQFFLQRAVQAEIVADNADFRAGRHVFEVFKTSMEAILSYRQRAFAGKVTLFAAEHHGDWFGSRSDPQLGWGKWAQGGVELHRVSGGHLEMVLEPHVAALAEKLRACLRSAQVS